MSCCDTCHRVMSKAEALIHADNWPDHKVVSVNEETEAEISN